MMMLLACVGTPETMVPMVSTRNHLKWCNSLPACEKSFVTIKEYAICKQCPVKLKHIQLPWVVRRALNALSDRNKTET